MYRLNKKELCEINKLNNKSESAFINKSLKSEYKYRLVVKLKAIKYKENFFYYLSSYFYY